MKTTMIDVEQVALLSRLEIPTDQQEDFTGRLNAILDYMEMLNSLDTTGIEPTAHVLPLKNVMRADETHVSLARELALSNAPEQEDGYFRVPKIMEG